jgi:hypothetical protein
MKSRLEWSPRNISLGMTNELPASGKNNVGTALWPVAQDNTLWDLQ